MSQAHDDLARVSAEMVSLRLPHESFSSLVKLHPFGFESKVIVDKLFSVKITDSK
jgi:hypothetical protein